MSVQNKEVTDEDWNKLLDPRLAQERIDTAKKEAEKQYGNLSTDDIQYLRNKAKNHLFFLCTGILGYNKLSPRLHGHYCLWITRNRVAKRRLELMPRGHYKSTVDTIGDSVQCILPDDMGGQPYPYNLGPEVRMLLGHETGVGSSRFLFQVTSQVTGNPKLIGLFPEIIPSPRLQRMNKTELELPRKGYWAEPTIDTMGVGARGQGRHYDLIKLDDIFGLEARDSQAMKEGTIEWFDNIEAFFLSAKTGKLVVIGTRYSLDDIYNHIIKKYGKDIIKYIRRVEEPVLDVKGEVITITNPDGSKEPQTEPIFPEEFPKIELIHLKKNKKTWIQYTNDPTTDANKLDKGWKRYFQYNGPKTTVSVFTGHSSESYKVRSLDITILTDPAISKLPGIVVTGTTPKLQVFILKTVKRDMKPPDFVECLFQLVQTYWPRCVTIEEAVFGKIYASWIQREMQFRGIRFNIIPIKIPQDRDKLDRVGAKLSNYFSAGQILFNIADEETAESDDENIIWEYNNFGSTENYHLLDALSQGPDVWRPGLDAGTQERYRKLEEQQLREIDPISGYSRQ